MDKDQQITQIKHFLDSMNNWGYPAWDKMGIEEKIELLALTVQAIIENKEKNEVPR